MQQSTEMYLYRETSVDLDGDGIQGLVGAITMVREWTVSLMEHN